MMMDFLYRKTNTTKANATRSATRWAGFSFRKEARSKNEPIVRATNGTIVATLVRADPFFWS